MNRKLLEALVATGGLKTVRVKPKRSGFPRGVMSGGINNMGSVRSLKQQAFQNDMLADIESHGAERANERIDRLFDNIGQPNNRRFKRGQRLAKFRRGIATEAAVSNKPKNPLEVFIASRNSATTKKKVKPFTPDKEVWHSKSKSWLDHKDPTLHEAAVAAVNLLIEKHNGYDYSSTQINVQPNIAKQVIDYGKTFIKDSELAAYGRDKEPHITIKYGLHTSNPHEVKEALKGVKPFRFKLGKISMFNCKDYDVVKIEVHSTALHKLNAAIRDNTECTDTHPTYSPHMTIAYVKKGFKLKDPGDHFEGMIGSADTIVFSAKDGTTHSIKLTGGGVKESAESIAAEDIMRPKFTPPMWLDDVVMAGRRAYRKMFPSRQDKQDKPRKMRMPKDNYYSSNQ